MTELVNRLRHIAKLVGFDLGPLLNEAADEIEKLRDQPQYLSGCLHPGNEPNSCQHEGGCQSEACVHYGKEPRS
jgi:hypothetical protein